MIDPQTAALIRDRELSQRALNNQKFALDQHAIVSITDLDGRITYANDRFCEISGYIREFLLGRDHRIISSGLHPVEFFEEMYARIQQGQVWHGELCNRARNGSLYWVNSTIVPLSGEDGQPEQYIMISTDISKRVRVEQALEVLTIDLENQIHRRTEALEEATKLAAQASRAKSDFLSNISHEMRTPMNSILGISYLALQLDVPPKVRDYLQSIQSSGQYLLALIKDVLDFSKIEAGKFDLETLDFLLPMVIDDVVRMVRESAQEKGIQIQVSVEEALRRPLRGDPLRIRQVLLNFASNAVKFSSRGVIEIRARVRSIQEHRIALILEVVDQGIGLSPEQAALLFQPFHQADTSTTRRFGGTGLGLAICHELAALMGGGVGVTSEIEAGSTFWCELDLPLGDARNLSSDADNPACPAPASAIKLQGRRILVVDDNFINQTVASEMLQAVGATVLLASNGDQAITSVLSNPIDCVLMDVQMPVMDGLETTRKIRTELGLTDLPILAMTANASTQDRSACLAAGMNGYLSKPVSPLKLVEAVAQCFEHMPATAL